MNVDCSFCEAKYNVSEDLVRGRVARFRCKKCGGIIPVDGRALAASSESQTAGRAMAEQLSMPPLVISTRGTSSAPPPPSGRPQTAAAPAALREPGRRGGALRWIGLMACFGLTFAVWKALSPASAIRQPSFDSTPVFAAAPAEQPAGQIAPAAIEPIPASEPAAATANAEHVGKSAPPAAPATRARAHVAPEPLADEDSETTPPGMPSSGLLPDPVPETLAVFDRRAAIAALDAAGQRAATCKPADSLGSTRVAVTFAPSGKVTTAMVEGPPFAGTRVGGCIATMLREATIPPFSGDPVTVHRSF